MLDLSWSRITDQNLKYLLHSCLGDKNGDFESAYVRSREGGDSASAGNTPRGDGDESDGGQVESEESELDTSIHQKTKMRKRVTRSRMRNSSGSEHVGRKDDRQAAAITSIRENSRDQLAECREGSLTHLNLTRCLRLTEKAIKHISKRGVSLQTLILSGASDCVTDRYAQHPGSKQQ